MKSSEALRRAKVLIAQGCVRHVCHALADVQGRLRSADPKLPVEHNIRKALGTSWGATRSLEGYWRDMGDEKLVDFIRENKAYRLAWIDWMIEGYEAIGD
jgi:hypothetical protein